MQHVGQRVIVEASNDDPQRDSYLMEILAKRHPETFARIAAKKLEPVTEAKPMVHVDLTSFSAQSLRRGGVNRQKRRQSSRVKHAIDWRSAAVKALEKRRATG